MPSQSSTPTSPRESRFSIRSVIPVAVVLLFLCGHTVNARATGPEFSWVPVDASVPYTTARPNATGEDTEITLAAGTSGQIVEFEIRISGWGSAQGSPTLGTAQAVLDLAGLLGVNAVPPQPGLDLTLLHNQTWREGMGGFGFQDGAFMALKTCHDSLLVDSLLVCGSEPAMTWNACPAGSPHCLDRGDFVFAGHLSTHEPGTASPPVWGGVTTAGHCTPDDGVSSYYLGTLVLNVPTDFVGTFTFGLDPAPDETFLNDCSGSAIPDLDLTPGHVTLETGACCTTQPGGGTAICADGVFQEDCQDFADIFLIGRACDDPGFTCPSCAIDAHCSDSVFCNGVEICDQAIGQCLPGSNPCTSFEACDESAGICRAGGVCCDYLEGRCTDQVLPQDCSSPKTFYADTLFCADLPDRDGDGVPDCADLCAGLDDAIYAPECVVPTLSAWGLLVLALLLLAAITIRFCHRRATRRATISIQPSKERRGRHSGSFVTTNQYHKRQRPVGVVNPYRKCQQPAGTPADQGHPVRSWY